MTTLAGSRSALADPMAQGRMAFIDGHRGLAILLVLGYHAFARWPDRMPFGEQFAGVWPFAFGWVGVRLFFLVSGFVILMTLERSANAASFFWRRWLRLFPAMLICSLLIYSTATLLPGRPAGEAFPSSLLPALTFTEPGWWARVSGWHVASLEGSFWSLYVEVKFYVIAALIYFRAGRTVLIHSLAMLYVASTLPPPVLFRLGLAMPPSMEPAFVLASELSLPHFGWFASGCAFFAYSQTRDRRWFLYAFGLAALSSVWSDAQKGGGLGNATASFLVAALFGTSLLWIWLQRLLASRSLLFFGFISYPLYLVHENSMVSMTSVLGHAYPALPALLMPLVPLVLLCVLSFVVARFLEPQLRNALRIVAAQIGGTLSRPVKS